MGEVNLLGEAIKFMFLGMGVVLAFLVVMIYALKLQAYLINRFLKVETKIETKEWKPETVDDKQITAAITAAIIHHNNIKG
jgi:oxaloacetate decarboxylase gamma subunit